MNLQQDYSRENFLTFLRSFIPDFQSDIRNVNIKNLKATKEAFYLGESAELDLSIFELKHISSSDARVTLATDGFRMMKESSVFRALIIYKPTEGSDWRLSLMTASPEKTEKGNIQMQFSNPKRYSFFLGPNAKVNTPYQFLIKKDKVINFDDLKNRFSLEVVNKEFYKEVSECFTKLVGGVGSEGEKKKRYESLLKLPSVDSNNQINIEFAVRLIGRLIFCWFLREKRSLLGKSLMPKELLSFDAITKYTDYYHQILEPIFFEILNKPVRSRRELFSKESFSSIPYLNGGLFSPQDYDYYKRNNDDLQSQYHNSLVIPDAWIKDFFKVLEMYNFTIDENTSYDEELSIDPEMLGRIFENLLAEINPETGESARKSTGSYYTPRAIVNYMVDESLFLYLKEQTKIEEKKLRALISYDLNDDIESPLITEEKEEIINALEKVKILDPACGSGAFPIGALQKIVFILQQADSDGKLWFKKQTATATPEFRRDIEKKFSSNELDFIRKLGVIRNSIYGVDVQPIATDISRLRCFLTLIVDEVIKDGDENRGIKPLPNLDFKFVTANSLIRLPKIDEGSQQLLFDERENIEKLRELMDEFFSADEQGKYMLMNSFNRIQKDLIKQYFSEKDYSMYEQKKILSDLGDWDPFSHKATAWFDSEWMFGVKDGFDIVLGNPPYVQLQKMKLETDILEKMNYKTFARTGDLYCLFYEQGFKLLRTNGILTFITSNKWMRAEYGEKLRNFFISDTNPILLIDFNGYKIFESVTVDNNILIAKKSEFEENIKTVAVSKDFSLENMSDYFRQNTNHSIFKVKNIWVILTKFEEEIKTKIENLGKPVKDLNLKIYRGILTGYNSAFIIDEQTKNQLIAGSPKNAEIIRPILEGKDIDKYVIDAKKWLIAIPFGWTDENKNDSNPEEFFQNKYPIIYQHFIEKAKIETKGKGLFNRDDQGNYWWELRACTYWNEFNEEKIVYSEIVHKPQFALDTEGLYFVNDTCFIMTGKNLHYIIALLNSQVVAWFFKKFYAGGGLGENGYRYKKVFLENLPIPQITSEIEDIFLSKVSKIQQLKYEGKETSNIEEELDILIYKAYEINQEEIEIIKKSFDV